MSSQNILKYYGLGVDLILDTSELYDYEIAEFGSDYNSNVLDFNNELSFSSLTINSSCFSTPINDIKPIITPINQQFTGDTCNFLVRRRTENGWTLDFIFNREDLSWTSGNTFYYWGISGETDPKNYLDNNLSFSFTSDGRIKWVSYHYSGYCHTSSGYTETSYISSGYTPLFCLDGVSDDFNITITFKRYMEYLDCDIENEGGWNDLVTGWTVNNVMDVITGSTEDFDIIEVLNNNWNSERKKRLGVLKIYLNGRLIYRYDNFEEIIPSKRESLNEMVQVWGGGTLGIENLHTGTTEFNLKRFKYFEEPLTYPEIRHHYLVSTKPHYSIMECGAPCVDSPFTTGDNTVLSEDGDYLITEDYYLINME
jgi:hypothetical protein